MAATIIAGHSTFKGDHSHSMRCLLWTTAHCARMVGFRQLVQLLNLVKLWHNNINPDPARPLLREVGVDMLNLGVGL